MRSHSMSARSLSASRSAATTTRAFAAGLLVCVTACVGRLEPTRGQPAAPDPIGEEPMSPATPAAPVAFEPEPAGLRSLTPAQYQASVLEVLGLGAEAALAVPRIGQWTTSVAAAHGGLSAAMIEQYEAAARDVAGWALADPARREAIVGCEPSGRADDPCATAVIARLGRRAFRRRLRDEELARWLGVVAEVSELLSDPWRGLEHALAGLLQSPSFLYRVELASEPTDLGPRVRAYSSPEMASRLSYLLWASAPDEALLDSAEAGELASVEGVERAATRMLADPRARLGLEELAADLLQADVVLAVSRDPALHPGFDDARSSLRASLVRTAVDALERGGFPELFTTRRTYVDARIAPYFGLSAADHSALLEPVELSAEGTRAGILTAPGLLAAHAYPTKPSPTLRGLFVRKRFLCGEISPPPPGVDTRLPDTITGRPSTARERLAIHQASAACASCHAAMDPIGLGLETFDEVGRARSTEQGLPIDPSGELDGLAFDDAVGLGDALAGHPALLPCMSSRVFEIAAGTQIVVPPSELRALAHEDLREVLVNVVTSEAFRFAWTE